MNEALVDGCRELSVETDLIAAAAHKVVMLPLVNKKKPDVTTIDEMP